LQNTTHAVIDLGTNTFHLLIAKAGEGEGSIEVIFRNRQFVKLADEGISTIGEKAYNRALNTLKQFRKELESYGIAPSEALTFGTAALRTASNGTRFIQEVQEQTGIRIQLIPGTREALLIHKGVSAFVPPTSERHLIMDIGGGSVEFIIASQEGIDWYQSFPIGVAVLFRDFYTTDPISAEKISDLQTFLYEELNPLVTAIRNYPARLLIGASGTFDVLDDVLGQDCKQETYTCIDKQDFLSFYQQVLPTTVAERRALENIPSSRADMIMVALILIKEVLEITSINKFIASPYAMKEGMLYELIHEQK
jgi:exopolyphosphatase/guanosine-5'-triphosphate,3'-diphosphate pyrophosphatase